MSVTDFGTDVDGVADAGASFATTSGLRNLGNALGRRLITPRGTLDYDREYGADIRPFLNSEMDTATASALRADVIAECEKDERVISADCDSAFEFKTRTLTLTVVVQTAAGPFRFVLAFGEVPSFELLTAEAA